MESDVRSGSSAKLVLQGEMIIACNNDALTLFRCDREALLGQSYLKFSAPTQPNGWRSADSLRLKETAAKAGQRQHFDWTCRRPDGLTFTARASLKRIKSRGKSYVQLSLKKAKESEPAEESLLKFRLGIERSNDAIFMTDIDGIITFANPAFERVYGYSLDEALGKTPRLLKSGVLDQEVYEDFWQTLLAKKVVAGEIINKTKDGNLIHIEGSNNPILDENGALIGFLSIHRDITERKQAEETFQNAQVELEQRVTERTSELARANVRLSEQFVEIQQVKEALERRNRILEALNELARQTTSSLTVQPVLESVLEFTAQIVDATSASASMLDPVKRTATVVAEYFGPEAADAELVSDLGSSYSLEPQAEGNLASLMSQDEIYIVHADDPDLAPEHQTNMEQYGAKSILGVRLFSQDTPVAELEFWESRYRREFSEEEIELIRAVARQAALALENARLYEQARSEIEERKQLEEQIRNAVERRGRQVRLSTQVTQAIGAATNLSDLFQRVVVEVKEQFGFYHTQLLRYEPSVDAVVLIAGYGDIGDKMRADGHRMPMGIGLIGAAAATGQSFLRPNVAEDPDWKSNPLLPNTRGELAVPIKLGEQVLGVLDIQSSRAGELSTDDQLALEGLCGQVAIAIERTRLRQDMEGKIRELNQLQRIMSREGWQVFQAQHEDDTKGYRYDRSAVQPVTTAQLPEGSNGPTGIVEQSVATGDQGKSVVSTPMTVRGETIGTLGIQEDPERPLEPEDHELLRSISVQVAEALESARLLEQTQKHAVAMEAVAQVSAAASTILDTPKLLETVTRLTKERFDLYHVAVFTLEDHKLHLSAGTAFPIRLADTEAAIVLEVYREKSLVARAARTRQPVLVNLVNRDPGYLPHPILPATRSELSIPLIVGEEILGVLDLQSNVANRFGEDDIRIHTTLAAQVAVALQNATLYAEQLKTAERLREVDRLKSEFLASMSHELRTPLNSIIGFADVLLEGIDGPLNERMNEDVSLIRDSGRHLRALIGEMLDMSKIEAGVMELHYEQINVPQFAQEIIANAKPLAVGKDLEISLNVAPGLNVIMADRTRLTQILLNLMSNAIKFTETGSITLSMGEHDGGLLASVKDTGIGIKQEDFPAIFEQFRQVDASLTRRIGGTGLGIPISKSLVELHGGQMWVDSKPGVGSTFSFTIPGKRMIGL